METPKTSWSAVERFERMATLMAEQMRLEQIAARHDREPSSETLLLSLHQAQVVGRRLFEALMTQQAE